MTNKYPRKLPISEDSEMITLPDSRFYKRNGKYYPSVTHILGSYPKGKYFEDWLKKVGYSADYLVRKSAEDGKLVHGMIEDYLGGKEISFLNKNDYPKMEPHVWKMFLNFVNFWETYEPKLIDKEIHLFSDKYQTAGTCDLVCEINNQLWIIDHKTSNHLQTVYELQTSIYSECFKECYGKTPDRLGVLWLNSKSRGPDKNGKVLKGKGWVLHESSRSQEDNVKIFEAVKQIFDIENPKYKPYNQQFPIKAKLNI